MISTGDFELRLYIDEMELYRLLFATFIKFLQSEDSLLEEFLVINHHVVPHLSDIFEEFNKVICNYKEMKFA